MRWGSWKVDWPNHLIGFFSALFGILIAFELDQWRETKNNQDDAQNAFDKIKQEIQINKSALHETLNTNLKLIGVLEEKLLPHVSDRLEFDGSVVEARSINASVRPIGKIVLDDTTAT